MSDAADLYRQIVESSEDGIWVFDAAGVTVFCNARAAGLLGRAPEEMRGLPVRDTLDGVGQAAFDAHLADLRAGRLNAEEQECAYLRPDGTHVWVMVAERALGDPTGRGARFVHRLTEHSRTRRLLAQLTRSREQLADAQTIAKIGSWERDLRSGASSWSTEMFRILRLDPEVAEPSVATFSSLVREQDRETVRSASDRLSSGADEEFQYDVRVTRGDGESIWVRVRGRLTRDPDGTPLRMAGSAQDVTDVKEGELQLLDAVVLNVMMQAMASAANEAETLGEALEVAQEYLLAHEDWNRAAAVRPEVDEDGRAVLRPLPVGRDGSHVVEPTDAEWDVARRTATACSVVFEEDARPQHPSIGFPVMEGDQLAAVIVITANSPFERHAMLRSMCEQVGGQLSRVAERERTAAELAAARDAAMEASRLKSQFLATMSHEIRTPLNGVIGLNDLLLRTGLDTHQRRLAEGVQGAGRSLLAVINDILDFSKIEAGKLQLESVDFDVRSVFDQVATLLAGTARDKGLELVVDVRPDVPERLTGDPTRLSQILTNLVSNAVKFTDHGEVLVRCDVAGRDGSRLELETVVLDTGIGVDEVTQTRLFEPFSQADASTTRTHGGTGLGLAISRQLVGAIGGRIGVESVPGEGSRFWFTGWFETAEPPAGALAEVAARAHMLQHRRALVVDDNATNRLVVTELLRGWQMDVTETESADEALTVVLEAADRGRPFDVVLLDLAMPGRDGLTLATMINDLLRDAAPRLMLLTSMPVGDASLADAGIRLVLDKPLSRSALLDGLADCLAEAHGAQVVAASVAQRAREPRGRRILVVEDNEVNQLVALGVLESLGYDADIAEDGEVAVAMAAPGRYDAILMDVQMPRLDGYAATRAIRAAEVGRRVPIVAMTAAAVEGEREACLAAGMDDFLTKPLEPQVLEQALESWLAAPARQPVLDRSRLDTLTEMGPGAFALVDKAVQSFLAQAPEALDAIASAVGSGDAGLLRERAHKLKGSAQNLGATVVGDLCRDLELLGGAGDATAAGPLVAELGPALDAAAGALRRYQDALTRT